MQVLWMVVSAFFFATMGVCIKYSAAYFHAAEIVFYRGLIGMLVIWAVSRCQRVSLRTSHPWMHARRSMVGVCALGCWFYAITQMPLASAMTLNYMSSIWMATFVLGAALWALHPGSGRPRQSLHLSLLATILLGFAGVVLMLQPSFAQSQVLAALLGLASGLLSALAYLQVAALAQAGEPDARTVFYFGVACTVVGFVTSGIAGFSDWPGWQASLWLLPMGLCAAIGQLTLTRAYACAQTARNKLVVASLNYSGIVFASLYSVVLFEDRLGWQSWLGMALIVISGLAATVVRSRQSA